MANARLGRPLDAVYFNSGLLIMDMEEWRRAAIGPQCIGFAQSRDDFWPDQDAINAVLDGRIMRLDAKWNFFSHEKLLREAFEDVHILHFIPEKPTSLKCNHPLHDEYLALKATTPWRDRPLTTELHDRRVQMLIGLAAKRVKQHKGQA